MQTGKTAKYCETTQPSPHNVLRHERRTTLNKHTVHNTQIPTRTRDGLIEKKTFTCRQCCPKHTPRDCLTVNRNLLEFMENFSNYQRRFCLFRLQYIVTFCLTAPCISILTYLISFREKCIHMGQTHTETDRQANSNTCWDIVVEKCVKKTAHNDIRWWNARNISSSIDVTALEILHKVSILCYLFIQHIVKI